MVGVDKFLRAGHLSAQTVPIYLAQMRKLFLSFYRKSPLGKVLLTGPRAIYKWLAMSRLSDEAWTRKMFNWSHHCPLNLTDPCTLNEKIQWLKLYNRDPQLPFWADKHRVRELVKHCLSSELLIPVYAVSPHPQDIEFESFQEPFIIKPTHLSGRVIIVRDKARINWRQVRKACSRWLKANLYDEGREWHYKSIPPQIIVEKLIVDANGSVPPDFKCHCLNGKVLAIQADIDRHIKHRRNFYDSAWLPLPFTWSVCVGDTPLWPHGGHLEKPPRLADMVTASELIAKRFPYVRVDWYAPDESLYFGETTFHHGGGYERIMPLEWDKKLGDTLKLNFAPFSKS